MKLLGIKPDSSEIAVLIIGERPETVRSALSMVSRHVKAKPDEAALELSRKKVKIIQQIFGISNIELKTVQKRDDLERALTDIVIERMALLATQH